MSTTDRPKQIGEITAETLTPSDVRFAARLAELVAWPDGPVDAEFLDDCARRVHVVAYAMQGRAATARAQAATAGTVA